MVDGRDEVSARLSDQPQRSAVYRRRDTGANRERPKVAKPIEQGEEMEPIIVVALDKTSQPIIAEGNKRSIAFQLAYSSDKEIEFLFGTSPNIDGWRFYNFA